MCQPLGVPCVRGSESPRRRLCKFAVLSRALPKLDHRDRSQPRRAPETVRLGLPEKGFCLVRRMLMKSSLPWQKSRSYSVKLLEDSSLEILEARPGHEISQNVAKRLTVG